MSPFMAIIVLGILLGTVVFLIALIRRKRGYALLALPFPLLILAWFVLVSTPPDADSECERLFSAEVRSVATDIHSVKPTFMDGHMISFRLPASDFQRLVTSAFSVQVLGGRRFFRRGDRPDTWPVILETMEECLRREFDEDVLLVYFEPQTQTVYASYHYASW
jgi:hypothetical protein